MVNSIMANMQASHQQQDPAEHKEFEIPKKWGKITQPVTY